MKSLSISYASDDGAGIAQYFDERLKGAWVNVFPTIFPVFKEGDRWKTDRAIGIQTQNLRDGFRKKRQDSLSGSPQ